MKIKRALTVLAIIILSILPFVFMLNGCGSGGAGEGISARDGKGQLKVSMAMRFVSGPDKSITPIPSNATGNISLFVSGPSAYHRSETALYQNGSFTFDKVTDDGTYSVTTRAGIT